MKKFVIGVDVGGTNTRLGLVNAKGGIVAKNILDTKKFIKNKDKLIQAVVEDCQGLIKQNRLRKKDVKGIGIGLPGLVNAHKGIVHFLPNIPRWNNVHLKKIVEKEIHIPTFIDNDVNLITLAEWQFGAGKGMQNLVCMTLGTGVGAGLVLNNQLYRGEGFAAGELGHIPINEKGPRCSCGGSGCVECYVGNRYLRLKARRVFKKNIRLEDVSQLAKNGNPKAKRFWQETAEHIGHGLVGVVNVLNPKMIVIGGGVSNAHQHLFKTIRQTIQKRAMKVQGAMVKIAKAKFGDQAGIIGARVLVKYAKSL